MRQRIEWFVMVTTALLLSEALWRFFSDAADAGIEGDPRNDLILAIIYSILAIYALSEGRLTMWSLLHNPALPALLGLACVSALWADMPELVIRRAVGLVGASLFGVVLATRYSFEEQLKLLRSTFRIAAGASMAILLVAPSKVLSAPGGPDGLRGVFPHKNGMGGAMALAFLVEWYLREDKPRAKTLRWVSLCAFAGLLAASDSMTSVVAVLAALGGVWVVRVLCVRCRLPASAVAAFALTAVIAATLAGAGAGDFTGVVGRSSDMTGRTELWRAVVVAIKQKPILGYGFSGFWSGASPDSEVIERQVHWTPHHSHNGYLDVALTLGFVGLSLALLLLAIGFKRAWGWCRNSTVPQDFWPLALFIFVVIHNMAECSIVRQNNLEWSVCVAAIIGCDPRLRSMFEPSEEIEDGVLDAA